MSTAHMSISWQSNFKMDLSPFLQVSDIEYYSVNQSNQALRRTFQRMNRCHYFKVLLSHLVKHSNMGCDAFSAFIINDLSFLMSGNTYIAHVHLMTRPTHTATSASASQGSTGTAKSAAVSHGFRHL